MVKSIPKKIFQRSLKTTAHENEVNVQGDLAYIWSEMDDRIGELVSEERHKDLLEHEVAIFEMDFGRKPTKKELFEIKIAIEVGIGNAIADQFSKDITRPYICAIAFNKLRK